MRTEAMGWDRGLQDLFKCCSPVLPRDQTVTLASKLGDVVLWTHRLVETSQSLFQGVLIWPPATTRPSWGAPRNLHRAGRSLKWTLVATRVGTLAAWWLLSGGWQRLRSHGGAAGPAVPMSRAATAMENRPKPLNLKRQANIFYANFSVGHAAGVVSMLNARSA